MTYHPTSRVLAVLELLQTYPNLSGPALAERLEVDSRTIRRYIGMLQDLGIPIESRPGRGGGYRLRPGFKLPPLMFNTEEATALVLGLLATRQLGLAEIAPVAEGALAKIERVLPEAIRARVRALQSSLTLDLPTEPILVPGALLSELSIAAREERQITIIYQGSTVLRTIDVYGVVGYRGRWYTVAYCHHRAGIRVFRLDRIEQATLLATQFKRPEPFDCLAYLVRSFAEIPDRWEVLVLLDCTLEHAHSVIPATLAVLEQRPDGILMRAAIDELGIVARVLAAADCRFQVLIPDELRKELQVLAERLQDAARNNPPFAGQGA